MADWFYNIGRVMQLIGLILLPLAMAGNLAPNKPESVGTMMWMTATGLILFFGGHALQRYAKPSE